MKYLCLDCIHLKQGKLDLMECELQTVNYINVNKTAWTMDPVCIHDAEVESRKIHSNDTYDTSELQNFYTER